MTVLVGRVGAGVGCSCWGRGAHRRCGRRFSGSLVGGVRSGVQAMRRRAQPVSMRWLQGQSWGSLGFRCRPVRMMRPATLSRRKRKRFGSHLRAGWCSSKASVWVQAIRSAARARNRLWHSLFDTRQTPLTSKKAMRGEIASSRSRASGAGGLCRLCVPNPNICVRLPSRLCAC